MSKNIKNYTTAVPVERTITLIESELVSIGATHIEKEYFNGEGVSLIFTIETPVPVKVKLPANANAAYDVVRKIPEYKTKKSDWVMKQAQRTACRILLN